MKKKGDLSLSVSAIVVLILAIVMLGLGLGFIRGMFGKVSTSFEEQIAAEPEPPAPSGAEPITLSTTNIIVRPGDAVALKAGIYNPTQNQWTNANFTISCSGAPTITTEPQFNAKSTLDPGQSFIGTYLFKVGTVSPDTYLCKGQSMSGGSPTDYSKEMVIKVLT